jgi:hypothetical protein
MEINNILNDDWIQKFENTDKLYQDFYKDDLCYINLKFIYINKNSEIQKIKAETFLMSSKNTISREEIIRILKDNIFDNQIKYTLLSILKCIIDLEPTDITHFLNKSTDENTFLKIITNIDAIAVEKTINMFQDLNELIFVFIEKTKDNKNDGDNNKSKTTLTKKIYMNSYSYNKAKTIRKTI